ncbi:MAG: chemotaxis protein CheB [Burkholderiaceae bacterium]
MTTNIETGQGNRPPPVVAIGASAGGIEALQQFFSALPADTGVAYVVIVHLAPNHESELPEILSRYTQMPVEQVGDHRTAKLEPDHVFVIAPDRKLEVTDSSVGASRYEQPHGRRATIDLFFRSLAARHGDGFAVILSGGGSDGALGARAIKEVGGLVLVQDPREAAYDGMPRATIATGIADVVLPVRELAGRLIELVRAKREVTSAIQRVDQGAAADDERALRVVLDLLRNRTGHDFSNYKRGTVLRRLARRMQLSDATTLSGYADHLKQHDSEVHALFNDLLISVTSYFRDPDAWRALRALVIAPLVERADPDVPIRCWVSGCATGEEAYSLAMLFQDEIDKRADVGIGFTIFATDIDERALAIAREGVYPGAIGDDISAARLERYFRREDHHYRVSSNIRDKVVIASHDLLRDPLFSRLDLICCRNLLIYLDRPLQEQVMNLFQYANRAGGYLFTGITEVADEQIYRSIDRKHRISQLQLAPDRLRPAMPPLRPVPRSPLRPEREARLPSRNAALELHLDMLEAVAPPSLVVDRQCNIVHLSNSASRFLEQRGGPIARQVTDVVRPELRDAVHSVLQRAFETGAEGLVSPLRPFDSMVLPVGWPWSRSFIAMLPAAITCC